MNELVKPKIYTRRNQSAYSRGLCVEGVTQAAVPGFDEYQPLNLMGR